MEIRLGVGVMSVRFKFKIDYVVGNMKIEILQTPPTTMSCVDLTIIGRPAIFAIDGGDIIMWPTPFEDSPIEVTLVPIKD
jgi:hypothetical protein